MASAPLTPPELSAYREKADRFEAELVEEYYLHLSGQKEELEIEPIYEQYAELTTLDAANAIGAGVNGDRRLAELWRFACSGYMGNLAKSQEARLNELEATLEAKVHGETIAFRMLRPTIANEEDRARRMELDKVRCELGEEHMNPIYVEMAELGHDAARTLGAESYYGLHKRFGFRLDDLAAQCRELLDSTERLYEEQADRLFRERIGVGLEEAHRSDVARLFRATHWDDGFPPDRMLAGLETTLGDLGVDLGSQANVELDVEKRETKSPRAYCFPIEVPGRVILMIQPIGGPDDWRALFHEAGHTEHFACTSADLELEERRMGDNAVTEGWAFLLEHLIDDPHWLTRRLDFAKPREFAAEGAVQLLFFIRRYSAKLLYEIELHQAADVRALRPRYVEILADALKIKPSETDWLADVDSGFYVTEYLRAWSFEAQTRFHLREQFGNEWFARREAGSLLRELWSLGQRPTADELLKDLTGAEIDMAAVGERVRDSLRA
jgi:hypothetical protein